jgi:hypothetical protein
MLKASIMSVLGFGALAACAPAPLIPVEQAMAECRARVLKPVETDVGIGLVLGGGKPRSEVSLGVGVDLAAATNPQQTYYDCVVRKSGMAPTEPLYPQGA